MDTTRKSQGLPLAVFVLGLTVFCIGTTDVMVSGLLPMLSRDLDISIPAAGPLISGYAAGVGRWAHIHARLPESARVEGSLTPVRSAPDLIASSRS